MKLIKWDPLRDLLSFQERVNRLQGAKSSDTDLRRGPCWCPALDILETSDAYVVWAALPGVGKENIEIEVVGRKVILSGSRTVEQEYESAQYKSVERVQGYFQRSFDLPGSIDVDKCEAKYVDGVLQLYLPKSPDIEDRCVKIECAG
ncbi:MAG: Hsp20/alpha crystallin family protein [Syntrophaceae bacterium]|nr:Hsp20/alpha crystallin family protein [Syntrophaceae bacterium]